MRLAVVSDIHGNLTAFEAVLRDLREMSPDLILHGGDLPHGGANPAEIVDRIRDLGWRGVAGNTDEMLWRPEALTEFASGLPNLKPMFDAIGEMAAATRELLGQTRLDWLRELPLQHTEGPVALVHASPGSLWRIPADPESAYGLLAKPIVVHGHTHRSAIQHLPGMTLIDTGSVSLSYDGDPRAAYLLLDGETPLIRRVEYDVEKEIAALAAALLPHTEWTAKMFRTAAPQSL